MTHWLDTAIFYEIYPQSFKDSDADGIGDFRGIVSRLDYIQSLGCNAIWMNPCFESPFNDAGYDVSNYFRAAPRYGTNEDLKALFCTVHDRGMRILLDLVPGHTSIAHPWFQASMRPDPNSFSDRYIWTNDVFDGMTAVADAQLCGWLRGISDRSGAAAVNFFSSQPALNYGYANPQAPWQQAVDAPGPRGTIEAMKDVMRFWLDLGCDGFRVDMALSLVKGDPDRTATIRLWREFRAMLDAEYPDAVMVSEWGNPNESLKGGFHMDFLLHFGESHYTDLFRAENPWFREDGKGAIRPFVETYRRYDEEASREALICIPSGNHDMTRIAYHLNEAERKVAFAFLLGMPGAPFIYYGDEIGMRYLPGLRSVEGGYKRTGSRSPMQWDKSVNAGFSSAPKEDLYIQIDPDPDRPTVADQERTPDSILNYVKKLIRVRQANEPLRTHGAVEFILPESGEYPLGLLRTGEAGSILVALNPVGESRTLASPRPLGETIFSVGDVRVVGANRIELGGTSAAYVRVHSG